MGAAIPAVIGAAGSMIGANTQGNAARDAAGMSLQGTMAGVNEQKREYESTRDLNNAYLNSNRSIAQGYIDQGDKGFQDATSGPSPYLAQAKQDILSQSSAGMQQASGQMNANLASQGVRGGQAATQLSRGVGQMGTNATYDVNSMMAQDEAQKNQAKQAYYAAMGTQGRGLNNYSLGIK